METLEGTLRGGQVEQRMASNRATFATRRAGCGRHDVAVTVLREASKKKA